MDVTSTWTDERVELLKKLWASGKSASQIAAQIGGVTRNAVIGKVHRLGLSGRGKVKSASTSRPRRAKTEAAPAQPRAQRPIKVAPISMVADAEPTDVVLPSINEVAIPPSERVALVDLRESMCRWPIGDPMTSDFGFCGGGAVAGLPYCAHHCQIAYQPVADRRRERRAS
ncbi:GcrA family cell cycle regulator [Microvirga sp. W0021]|uniref:GcrA family cell cycle regulator n=1 Tax=Hohaiivirga grylli TaxID=3133970 RepID=A0ABV0BGQ1_9HYPH